MNTETINQVKELLAPVAQKIGQGAEFGWEVVLRQQYVTATLGGVAVLIGIVMLATSLIVGFKAYKLDEKSPREGWDVICFLSFIVGGMVSSAFIITGSIHLITRLMNPEFYAIQFFIGLAK